MPGTDGLPSKVDSGRQRKLISKVKPGLTGRHQVVRVKGHIQDISGQLRLIELLVLPLSYLGLLLL